MPGGVFPNVYRARDVGVSFSSELPAEYADVPARLTAASVPAAGDRSQSGSATAFVVADIGPGRQVII
jgi:hypothetical protein